MVLTREEPVRHPEQLCGPQWSLLNLLGCARGLVHLTGASHGVARTCPKPDSPTPSFNPASSSSLRHPHPLRRLGAGLYLGLAAICLKQGRLVGVDPDVGCPSGETGFEWSWNKCPVLTGCHPSSSTPNPSLPRLLLANRGRSGHIYFSKVLYAQGTCHTAGGTETGAGEGLLLFSGKLYAWPAVSRHSGGGGWEKY